MKLMSRIYTMLGFVLVVNTSLCAILAGAEVKELGVKIERNVPVPMRDGTILRADIFRPDGGGAYPVLVERTASGKGITFDRWQKPYVKAGYIVVSQDVRGRYESEGIFESLWRLKTHHAEDGYDTIEWAAKIPGSNGKVGGVGYSWPAFMQWRLAPMQPPSLVAMSACAIPARLCYGETSTLRPGFRLGTWTYKALDMRRHENLPGVWTSWENQRLWKEEEQKWINWLTWLELPEDFFAHETVAVKSWLRNPHVDPLKLDEGCKDILVPNLDIIGWYDHGLGDLLLFRTIVKEGKTETARKGSRIIVGPWQHGAPERQYGDIDFGPNAIIDTQALRIRWFDYWLKDRQNGVDKDPSLRIFVMGDNKWRDERHWPLRRTKDKTLFITSEGHANTPNGDGKLVNKTPSLHCTDKYVYDPNNPVPTPYGLGRPRPADQRSLAGREDILVYQTQPLKKRIEVTGNPTVELYASSSAPDTDWFARLIDVHPDGLAFDVSHGFVRARYRNGLDKPELIKPHEVVRYSIRMSPTSNAFLPGHRIRLDITSSDFPQYDRNHNTAADQCMDATLVTARQTIYHGGEQATRIILPWVPNLIVKEEPTETETPVPEPEERAYPLHQAAADGDIEKIRQLLSKKADVNVEDANQMTPEHYAAKTRNKEIVQLLMEAGADVNSGGTDRWTPLHDAAKAGNKEIVQLLIEAGAEVNSRDINGRTALHSAVAQRHKDIAELLIKIGADVNAQDRYSTPLLIAVQRNYVDMASLLIGSGADFDSKDERGLTPLHNAAVRGYADIAELILSKGAKVDERDDNYEFTALHYAARFGSTKVAEVLIAHSADIKAKDKWAYESIHWAAYHDRPEIIELLITKGADVNVKTSLGQTPLELAIPRRNTDAIAILRKHGASE